MITCWLFGYDLAFKKRKSTIASSGLLWYCSKKYIPHILLNFFFFNADAALKGGLHFSLVEHKWGI